MLEWIMDDHYGEQQKFRADVSVENIIKCESSFFYDGRTNINVLKKVEILGSDENWYNYPSVMNISKRDGEYSACIVYNGHGNPAMYKTKDYSDSTLIKNASDNGINVHSLYE